MELDYTSFPRAEDSISFLYLEHVIIERENSSIVAISKTGRTQIPVKTISVLLLGPGTTVTHAAVQIMTQSGLFIVWCGESMRKFYAYGYGETRNTERLLKQVSAFADVEKHLMVARRMYQLRFPNIDMSPKSLKQMRGAEGIRMRDTYSTAAARFGVRWHGRKYKSGQSAESDLINQALNIGNDLLYSICESLIIALGYSPSIGFIHTGHVRSFVFDIADLYKAETIIPACFEATSKHKTEDFSASVRKHCRSYFREKKTLAKIPKDLAYIFEEVETSVDFQGVNNLWDIHKTINGGHDYSDDDEEEEDIPW